jgi:8-oxo-dGTP diphosphatase
MPSTVAESVAPGRLHVAVAAISDSQRRVLISLRPDHVHQGGLWEFPGGKLEPGETVERALARELYEELGVTVESAHPLIRIPFTYPDRQVLLDVWQIEAFSGEIHGREGQVVEWVAIDELGRRAFPPANRPIIQALQLPSEYLITPDPGSFQINEFLLQLQGCLARGIGMVQLRAPSLGVQEYAEVASRVLPLCRANGALLLLNSEPELVEKLGADGIHLTSRRLQAFQARPLPGHFKVLASCHNPEQLGQAVTLGADAVVLSPVRATASHPDTVPIGWENFSAWVDGCSVPVYALGGMRSADLSQARRCGGQGISAIRALWNVE